jgi:transcriptional repressor NrdR
MRCPVCNATDTQVRDSRQGEEGTIVRRRRECGQCHSRFTTFERIQQRELMVVKKNGQRRVFDRDKMARSITMALRKRQVPSEQVDLEIGKIIHKLESRGDNEILSTLIGEMIMDMLSRLDMVAYVRFASVYRDFKEAKDFEKFLSNLRNTSRP